jgi:hypothetical protein
MLRNYDGFSVIRENIEKLLQSQHKEFFLF